MSNPNESTPVHNVLRVCAQRLYYIIWYRRIAWHRKIRPTHSHEKGPIVCRFISKWPDHRDKVPNKINKFHEIEVDNLIWFEFASKLNIISTYRSFRSFVITVRINWVRYCETIGVRYSCSYLFDTSTFNLMHFPFRFRFVLFFVLHLFRCQLVNTFWRNQAISKSCK